MESCASDCERMLCGEHSGRLLVKLETMLIHIREYLSSAQGEQGLHHNIIQRSNMIQNVKYICFIKHELKSMCPS